MSRVSLEWFGVMAGDGDHKPLLLLAANGVLLLHVLFVVFALLGGFLLRLYPPLIWLHLPIALWAGLVMVASWRCPLTPLEKQLRARGGEASYRDGFVEHYLLPLFGKKRLTSELQQGLGWAVLAGNAVLYGFVFLV